MGNVRILAVFLALVLVLTGCSGRDSAGEGSVTVGDATYWLNRDRTALYVDMGKGPKRLAQIDLVEGRETNLSVTPLAAGNAVVTITNTYGEPGNATQLITVFHRGSEVQMTEVHYRPRFEENVVSYEGQVLLTDGSELQFIDDATGKVVRTIRYVDYGLPDQEHFVEGVGDGYLLVRPQHEGTLTLLDLESGATVALYKEFFSAEEQAWVETEDVPFKGDWLKFTGEEDGLLTFTNRKSLFGTEGQVFTYQLHP